MDVDQIVAEVRAEYMMEATGALYRAWYRIVDKGTMAQIAAGVTQERVLAETAEGWARAEAVALARVREAVERQKYRRQALGALGGWSFAEAAVALTGWRIAALGAGRFYVRHPAEDGQAEAVTFGPEQQRNGWPGEAALLAWMKAGHLVAPAGCEAEDLGQGEVALGCQVVQGAAGYRWYAWAMGGPQTGLETAWSVSSPTGIVTAQNVAAGSYWVRAGAVDGGGKVGMLGELVQLVVAGETEGGPYEAAEVVAKRSWIDRVLRR